MERIRERNELQRNNKSGQKEVRGGGGGGWAREREREGGEGDKERERGGEERRWVKGEK